MTKVKYGRNKMFEVIICFNNLLRKLCNYQEKNSYKKVKNNEFKGFFGKCDRGEYFTKLIITFT